MTEEHERTGGPGAPVYALMTAARDEASVIESVLRSVVEQTLPPVRWVIASDGSTDRTDQIVAEYAERFDFIRLLRVDRAGGAGFGGKVRALEAARRELSGVAHDYLGNLDADISFAPDYFARLLAEFARNPTLGIAGGLIHERVGDRFLPQRTSDDSVGGAVQLFRAACFEEIGGYLPLERGGEDAAAEILARMHGWKVRTVRSLPVRHHRRVLGGTRGMLGYRYNRGIVSYLLGYHPLFQIATSAYRVFDAPPILGSLLMTAGYWSAFARRLPRALPDDAIRFLRREQMSRLIPGRRARGAARPGASGPRGTASKPDAGGP